ncbi:LysM repeat protein [Rossellomorea marisflavi]
MGIKRTKKPTTQPKNAALQGAGPIEAQVEAMGHRMLSIFCGIVVVGSLLLLIFFFSSGVRGNIIASRATPVHAETGEKAEAKQGSPDLVSALSDPHTSREDAVGLLARMSDDDFQAFVKQITEKQPPSSSTDPQSEGVVDDLHELLTEGDHPGKPQIMAYLSGMDNAEFNAFITAAIAAILPESTDVLLKTSLEDAYAEAEKQYPGRIDGSKRLKLVEDLNATDYMYYVAEEGDTLIKLSRMFHVPLGQLVELNGIHDADVLPAGMILLFPSDTEQPEISKHTK